MVRYLFYMGYIGTRYRGAAKQIGCERLIDIDSVQGAIEAGLSCVLKPRSRCYPKVQISSRTDAGVHALINTAQVELEHPTDEFYDTDTAIRRLNSWFARCGHEIRITSIYPVTDEFDPRRNAKSRSYFYRIMIAKDFNEHKVPIAELQRAWHIRGDNIDIDALRAATRLFIGKKNFETFAGKNRTLKDIRYVRELNNVSIEPAAPFMPFDPLSELFNFWHINICARAFLYNQVRKIVGALVGIASGVITERDVTIMLQVPSHLNWDVRIQMAPPQGLFLKHIEYDKEELAKHILKPTNVEERPRKLLAIIS
ncbi:tRNA pseudouridine synthase-like 1 [Microplitis mediator]|uniref:tRNA pseudouridine synthase-like 1 n=1 Tax=Microplitis mediator TaxID=375433 RepID=UPI00255505A7|nr:tRNA pseudouridine synthase-like 1 [Microplitis mediator]